MLLGVLASGPATRAKLAAAILLWQHPGEASIHELEVLDLFFGVTATNPCMHEVHDLWQNPTQAQRRSGDHDSPHSLQGSMTSRGLMCTPNRLHPGKAGLHR